MRSVVIIVCFSSVLSFHSLPHRQRRSPFLPRLYAVTSLDLPTTTSNDTSPSQPQPQPPPSLDDLPRLPLEELSQLVASSTSYEPAIRAAVAAEQLYAEDDLPAVLDIWSKVTNKLQLWHQRQNVILENEKLVGASTAFLAGMDVSHVHVYTARDAAMHAESLLSNKTTSHDAVVSVMECWRSSRDELAPQHVKELMGGCKSAVMGHQLLMETYATARNVENRVERLEAMLKEAPQRSVRMCNAMLQVYSRFGEEKVEAAMNLFNSMKQTYEATQSPIDRPNQESYNTIMECLAATESLEAVDQAEELLQELKVLGEEDSRYKPSVYTYGTLIKAYSRMNQPQKAQAILLDAPPSTMLSTSVLHAWSRSKHPEKPIRALKLLQEMKQNELLQPTTVSYNAVIEACHRSRNPAGLKIAFAVFRSLEQDPNCAPDYWAIVNLLSAISRFLPSPSEERNEIARTVFEKAKESQLVHRKVLGRLVQICDNDFLRELLTPHMTPDERGRFDFEQIPLQWSKNTPP